MIINVVYHLLWCRCMLFIYKEIMKQRKIHIRKTIRDFINENLQNEKLIQLIKESLVMDTLVDEEEFNELYNSDLELAWKSGNLFVLL